MRSPTFVRAAALLCALAGALHAQVRPTAHRLPEWLDALLTQCEAKSIQYESITLSVPEDADARTDRARVEVISPERFWRLASLVELRAGEANMKNAAPPGGERRSEADFELALEPPALREGDLDKLRTAAEDLGALADHMVADSAVHLGQLLASRPSAVTLFNRAVQKLPVRITLSGQRAAVLSRLAQLPVSLPFAYLRSVRATPVAGLTVAVSLNLLVKPSAPQPTSAPAAELQRKASEALAAAVPDAKVLISSPAGAESTILSVKGTARDAAAARAALTASVALPGLRGFDELGWKNESGGLQLTGLLQF